MVLQPQHIPVDEICCLLPRDVAIFDTAHNHDYDRIKHLLKSLAEKDHLGPNAWN